MKKRTGKLATPEAWNQVKALYESGLSVPKVAEKMGVHPPAIYRTFKVHKYKARGRSKKRSPLPKPLMAAPKQHKGAGLFKQAGMVNCVFGTPQEIAQVLLLVHNAAR